MFRKIADAQPFHKALHAGRIRSGWLERTTSKNAQGCCNEQSTAATVTTHYRHPTQVRYCHSDVFIFSTVYRAVVLKVFGSVRTDCSCKTITTMGTTDCLVFRLAWLSRFVDILQWVLLLNILVPIFTTIKMCHSKYTIISVFYRFPWNNTPTICLSIVIYTSYPFHFTLKDRIIYMHGCEQKAMCNSVWKIIIAYVVYLRYCNGIVNILLRIDQRLHIHIYALLMLLFLFKTPLVYVFNIHIVVILLTRMIYSRIFLVFILFDIALMNALIKIPRVNRMFEINKTNKTETTDLANIFPREISSNCKIEDKNKTF